MHAQSAQADGASAQLRSDFEAKAVVTDAKLASMSKQMNEEVVAKLERLDKEVGAKLKPLESSVGKVDTAVQLMKMDSDQQSSAITELGEAVTEMNDSVTEIGDGLNQVREEMNAISVDAALISMAKEASPR